MPERAIDGRCGHAGQGAESAAEAAAKTYVGNFRFQRWKSLKPTLEIQPEQTRRPIGHPRSSTVGKGHLTFRPNGSATLGRCKFLSRPVLCEISTQRRRVLIGFKRFKRQTDGDKSLGAYPLNRQTSHESLKSCRNTPRLCLCASQCHGTFGTLGTFGTKRQGGPGLLQFVISQLTSNGTVMVIQFEGTSTTIRNDRT